MYGEDGHMEQVLQEAAAYRAGLRARASGQPRTANPYPQNSCFPEWDAGWEDGRHHATSEN